MKVQRHFLVGALAEATKSLHMQAYSRTDPYRLPSPAIIKMIDAIKALADKIQAGETIELED